VDGSSDLAEDILDHFEGWRGSRPVRIGNGAADQLQLDIYGEAADAIFLADGYGIQLAHQGWTAFSDIIDWLCEHWDQPEEGIWETRGGRKDFTYGRFQTWVALDRAIRLAAQRSRPADIARWTAERDQVCNQIMQCGWNPKIGAFTQHYDTEVLDSSLLMMPQQGLIAPRDPMCPHLGRTRRRSRGRLEGARCHDRHGQAQDHRLTAYISRCTGVPSFGVLGQSLLDVRGHLPAKPTDQVTNVPIA
jgi:GH15 family glucan-1,4-alpha-glucosidase